MRIPNLLPAGLQRRLLRKNPANTRRLVLMLLLSSARPGAAQAPTPVVDAKTYDRAANFLRESAGKFILNASVQPHWRQGKRERLTYRKELGDGRYAFVQIDAATGTRSPAFDQTVVAAGLSKAMGKSVDPTVLPFSDYDETGATEIRFDAEGKAWTCSTASPACTGVAAPTLAPNEVASPDGQWVAYVDHYNLWVRSRDGTTRFALTTDGVQHNAYAVATELSIGADNADGKDHAAVDSNGRHIGLTSPTEVAWSRDSRRLLTHRLDERNVRETVIVQSTPTDGTQRPIATSWRMAMPNDPVIPMSEQWVFDVAERTGRRVSLDPMPTPFWTHVQAKEAWWSADSRRIYDFVKSRYNKSMTLYVVDPASGQATKLISEAGKTFVEGAEIGGRPMVYPLANGDVIWFSERDGYGHLYLYDGTTGALKRRLTEGPWTVRNVLHLDEARGAIYVAGNEREPGRDPYFRMVYRVGLADGKVTPLTPEDADHAVRSAQESVLSELSPLFGRTPAESRGFSPSGRYFIETQSRTEQPSRTVLRDVEKDGKVIAEIEHADITRLAALGFTPPERFSALAADGKTVLYGNLLRPSNFDASKRYPVLDAIYPGPQHSVAVPNFEVTVFHAMTAQAYAELGFIVVLVDGRGSQGRSKAFHDESYSGLGQAGHIDDHVAVIKELARRYPYMDLDRVGIYGTSGGGYASTHAILTYPDFFKVAVSDAGNHDQRGYLSVWGETYNGPESGDNYLAAANPTLVANLKGKLFLLHGDMDINVSPYLTLQLVDALIKANKEFDMLIVPNAGHGTALRQGYALRRAWDYMVRNLMGATPPAGYDLSPSRP
ncbi:MAG: prolyl oligopeptidase family serine peptidase [Gemmatimonadaceae bacterium]